MDNHNIKTGDTVYIPMLLNDKIGEFIVEEGDIIESSEELSTPALFATIHGDEIKSGKVFTDDELHTMAKEMYDRVESGDRTYSGTTFTIICSDEKTVHVPIPIVCQTKEEGKVLYRELMRFVGKWLELSL